MVVLHDESLARTTDGGALARALPLVRVQRHDAGYRFEAADGGYPHRGKGIHVPTLDALLAAHPDTPLNIEIKQDAPPIEAAVLRVLDRHGARERTLLAAEHHHIMERIRTAAPDVVTSFSAHEVVEFMGRLHGEGFAGYRPPGVALQVPPAYEGTTIVTDTFVRAAHDLGVEVHVWTINDDAEMERLLDLGVDAIMTDVPARAAAVYRRRGLR